MAVTFIFSRSSRLSVRHYAPHFGTEVSGRPVFTPSFEEVLINELLNTDIHGIGKFFQSAFPGG